MKKLMPTPLRFALRAGCTLAALSLAMPATLRAQASQVAFWNFDGFDPINDTQITNGVGSFDWSNIGTADTSSVAGVSGDGIAFTNVADPGKYFDIALDLTGRDIPILSYFNARDFSNLAGAWSYSVDGGTSFTLLGYSPPLTVGPDYGAATIILESATLRNQADAILRYTFAGNAGANTSTAKFDNISVRATEATQIAAFVAGGKTSQRAMLGQVPQVNFSISERTGAAASYTLTGTNLNVPAPFSSGNLAANEKRTLPTSLNATGALAGDTVQAKLNITNTTTNETSSAAMDFQMVDNRAISTGATGSFGNIGRVVAGHVFGQVTFDGGSATDSEATRVTMNAGEFTVNPGTGPKLVLSTSGTVFNDANQTALADVYFPTWGGYGSRNVSIANLNATNFTPKPWGAEIGTTRLLRGEGLAGEALNLQGASLNVQAVVLANRQITGGVVSVGRQMVDTNAMANITVSGSATATLHGGVQGDNTATRVNLQAATTGDLVNDGVEITTSATSFNGPNITSVAGLNYNFEVDTTVTGATTKVLNLASALSDGEAASAGATLQNSLNIGAKYTVVADRQLYYDSHVRAVAVTGTTFLNPKLGTEITTSGDDDHFTRLMVGTVAFNQAWSNTYYTAYNGPLYSAATTPNYQLIASEVRPAITGEGLSGETVQDVAVDVSVKYIDPAQTTLTPSKAGELGVGDSITIANAAAGAGDRAGALITGSIIGGGFTIASQPSISGSDSQGYFYGGVAPGSSSTLLLGFNSAGRMNGRHTATLSFALENYYNDPAADIFLGGTASQHSYQLSHTVTGASGQSGNATVASGQSLKNAGIGLNYTGSFTNEAGFLDSATFGADTDIQIAYLDASTAPEAQLVSDIVDIYGLDGIRFVLQLKYDEAAMVSLFGDEEYAQINWFNTDYNLWMNSIYGNSDQGFGAQKFSMSYDDYLGLAQIAGTPQLSHYGVDVTSNVVWAVLDHNSQFGSSGPTSAVPEPSALMLVSLAIGGYLTRRRIRR